MRPSEIIRAVMMNIISNKFRVFLTMLGIIVGSATIVLVIGIGKGGEADVENQFSKLNANAIYINSSRGKGSDTVSEDDLNLIKENATYLEDITITISGNGEIIYNQDKFSGGIVGVNPNYSSINDFNIEVGEFIRMGDSEKRNRVIVIGSEVALELFPEGSEDAIGELLTIKGRRYEIIGVLERTGKSSGFSSIDENVYLPYEVALNYVIGGKQVKPAITAIAKDIENTELLTEEITEILDEAYAGSGGNPFMIRDAGSMLDVAKSSAKTMSILLTSVAVIVLIVGGIGIMNVLFVSVKERTKEIGVLKAIGTKRRDILLQFLLESIIISVMGGILGIFLSFLMVPLMKFIDVTFVSSINAYIIALAFSVFTGTFFGYYPAVQAAALKPIDALRYE